MNLVEQAPKLKCTFTAANGTLLTAYPWTGAGEIRPSTNPQWAMMTGVGFGTTNGQIQSNAARFVFGSNEQNAVIQLPSRATKIVTALKNTDDATSDAAVLLRCNGSVNIFWYVGLVHYAAADVRLEIWEKGANFLLKASTPLVDLDFNTVYKSLVVYDNGSVITGACLKASGVGALVHFATTSEVNNTYVGIISTVAGTMTADNLSAWY
jgi:hypothetical protein